MGQLTDCEVKVNLVRAGVVCALEADSHEEMLTPSEYEWRLLGFQNVEHFGVMLLRIVLRVNFHGVHLDGL